MGILRTKHLYNGTSHGQPQDHIPLKWSQALAASGPHTCAKWHTYTGGGVDSADHRQTLARRIWAFSLLSILTYLWAQLSVFQSLSSLSLWLSHLEHNGHPKIWLKRRGRYHFPRFSSSEDKLVRQRYFLAVYVLFYWLSAEDLSTSMFTESRKRQRKAFWSIHHERSRSHG